MTPIGTHRQAFGPVVKSFLVYDFVPWATALLIAYFPIWTGALHYFSMEFRPAQHLRELFIESFRGGEWPLWNPFSGAFGSNSTYLAGIHWDYRLGLEALGMSHSGAMVVDALLILAAFLLAGRLLFNRQDVSSWILFFGFAVFWNVDSIRYHQPKFWHSSPLIAFPLLGAIIIWTERHVRLTRHLLWLPLLTIFAFHGTQIGISLVQFTLAFGLIVLVCRLVQGAWNPFSTSTILYGLALGIGFAANLWQIRWLQGLIEESGRVQAGTDRFLQIVGDFFRSFGESPILLMLAVYFGVTLLLYRRDRRLFSRLGWIGLLFSGIWIYAFPPWGRLKEDVTLNVVNLASFGVALSLVLWVSIRRLKLHRQPGFLFIELPALFLVGTFFLLYNQYTHNYGPTGFEGKVWIFRVFLLLAFVGSLMSRDRYLLRVFLLFLVGIVFLRAHANVLLIKVLGVVWHDFRDDFCVSFAFSMLGVLGVRAWMDVFSLPSKFSHWIFKGSFSAVAVFAMWTQFRESADWHPPLKEETPWFIRHGQWLAEQSGGQLPTLLFDQKLIPTTFLHSGIRNLNIYDSTLSKYAREAFQEILGTGSNEEIPSACRLPYIWLPNNIRRIWPCSRELRASLYMNSIFSPNTDDPVLIQSIAKSFGVDIIHTMDPNFTSAHYTKIKEVERSEPDGNNAKLFVWKSILTPVQSYAWFSPTSCESAEEHSWQPLPSETTLFKDPILKRSFVTRVLLPKGGCLRLSTQFSKFWDFRVGRESLRSTVVSNGVTGLSVQQSGLLEVKATYYAPLERLALIGTGVAIGLFGLFCFFYQRSRKVVL